MSRAARSLLVFGVYLIALGLALAIAPNAVTRLVGVPETREPWLRLVGALAVNIGAFYSTAAIRGLRPIAVASVPARLAIPVWLLAFIVFADADRAVMVFGLADLVGAIWTLWALRTDRRPAADRRSSNDSR